MSIHVYLFTLVLETLNKPLDFCLTFYTFELNKNKFHNHDST